MSSLSDSHGAQSQGAQDVLQGLEGVHVALPTLYDGQGAVHIEAMILHAGWLKSRGIQGFVCGGTTGEGYALTTTELKNIIKALTQAHDAHVIAGISAMNLAEAQEKAEAATQAGASMVMVAPVPYIRCGEEGFMRYLRAIDEATRGTLPIMLYNNPARTEGVSEESIWSLSAAIPRIVALKESSSDCTRALRLGKYFAVFAGDDALFLPFLACGAKGLVSVGANVLPDLYINLHKAFVAGEKALFEQYARMADDVSKKMFCAANPIALYHMMGHLPFVRKDLTPRLPLPRLTVQQKADLEPLVSAMMRMYQADAWSFDMLV